MNFEFTWSNRHQDETFAMERLDRVVVNKFWLEKMECLCVDVPTSRQLDHLSIMITIRSLVNSEVKG